jgi:hypothetical protein
MSSIRIESLNCHKAEGPTMSFINTIIQTRPGAILLLQEPWLVRRKGQTTQPPNIKGYSMWIPNGKANIVTYIPNKANYQPRMVLNQPTAIGIEITLPLFNFTIYNLYSPARAASAIQFIHSFKPSKNSVMMGDFNAHHEWWEGENFENRDKNRHGIQQMVDDLIDQQWTLANKQGTKTHYPQNGNNPRTIDLTFLRG